MIYRKVHPARTNNVDALNGIALAITYEFLLDDRVHRLHLRHSNRLL